MRTMSPFREDARESADIVPANDLREFDEGETWLHSETAPGQPLPVFEEEPTGESFGESTGFMSEEPGLWGHRWTDWRPVPRSDETDVITESALEQQVPPAGPIVSKTFSPEALAELPAVLQAKPIVDLETTVPTELILWMVEGALNTPGPEPGWADRLLVDLKDLPKAGPTSTVHVTVFQTVPFLVNEADKLQAFERYCVKQYPAKIKPIYVLTVGDYLANGQLERLLHLPAETISSSAGLAPQMPPDQAANYKLVIYGLLPNTVGRVVAPRDQRSLRGFEFGKWLLTSEHERLLDSLGREVVHSLLSRRSVARIAADGHTDPVGTREFNVRLGQHRAEAVAKRLKEIIDKYAAAERLPTSAVDRIQYVVTSYGEDRPISRTMQSLNRRVEVTVYRDYRPPPQPLDEDATLRRQLDILQNRGTSDSATTKRLECLLLKLRQSDVDDRYANDTQVFLINRDNKLPAPTEWNRVRSTVLDPNLFDPRAPEASVIRNLEQLDEDIAGGIAKMIQIIDYAQGPDYGLGLLALANAFKQFNAWVMTQLKSPASIYSCYADLFL
jgi:hypothetical protein